MVLVPPDSDLILMLGLARTVTLGEECARDLHRDDEIRVDLAINIVSEIVDCNAAGEA